MRVVRIRCAALEPFSGKAIHFGVVGSNVSGGSPTDAAVGRDAEYSANEPCIAPARICAAAPIVERNGTPNANEDARGSARGGAGAAETLLLDETVTAELCASGMRDCSGKPSCTPPVADDVAVELAVLVPLVELLGC